MSWKIVYRFVEDEEDNDRINAQINACCDIEWLRAFNYGWFEVLGKLALDDYAGRARIGRRMRHAEARMITLEGMRTLWGALAMKEIFDGNDTPNKSSGLPEPSGSGGSDL